MPDLNFSQPERRSFLVPGLIALAVLGGAFALFAWLTPHRIADIIVTHTAILPIHSVLKSGSMVVGVQDEAHDDLYVLATVRIDDKLKLPLFLKDITATFSPADGDDITTSAVEKNDIPNLYVTFPALEPLGSAPLLRETELQPGQQAEGMVLLHFPVTQQDWDQRKSATVNVQFYQQGTLSVTIPKP
jgi:hypothetical protein